MKQLRDISDKNKLVASAVSVICAHTTTPPQRWMLPVISRLHKLKHVTKQRCAKKWVSTTRSRYSKHPKRTVRHRQVVRREADLMCEVECLSNSPWSHERRNVESNNLWASSSGRYHENDEQSTPVTVRTENTVPAQLQSPSSLNPTVKLITCRAND